MSGGQFTPTRTIPTRRESVGFTVAIIGVIGIIVAMAAAGLTDRLGGSQTPYFGAAGISGVIAFIGVLLWSPKKS